MPRKFGILKPPPRPSPTDDELPNTPRAGTRKRLIPPTLPNPSTPQHSPRASSSSMLLPLPVPPSQSRHQNTPFKRLSTPILDSPSSSKRHRDQDEKDNSPRKRLIPPVLPTRPNSPNKDNLKPISSNYIDLNSADFLSPSQLPSLPPTPEHLAKKRGVDFTPSKHSSTTTSSSSKGARKLVRGGLAERAQAILKRNRLATGLWIKQSLANTSLGQPTFRLAIQEELPRPNATGCVAARATVLAGADKLDLPFFVRKEENGCIIYLSHDTLAQLPEPRSLKPGTNVHLWDPVIQKSISEGGDYTALLFSQRFTIQPP